MGRQSDPYTKMKESVPDLDEGVWAEMDIYCSSDMIS